MAKMIKPALFALGLLTQSQIALAAAPDFPPEVVDAQAVDAFKNYWNAFEAHEQDLLKDGQKQFSEEWNSVKRTYQKAQAKISSEQLSALQKSAAVYRKHLEERSEADNRPYVMLNLAQILSLIGDHLAAQDEDGGTFAREEALTLLKELAETYRSFAYREQAMYLRATLLQAMGREDAALAMWEALASQAQTTLYGVHARIEVGDHMFKRERPGDAMRAYQKALSLLPSVDAEDPGFEQLRINYRLAWAAYRAGELPVVVTAASDLLLPTAHSKSASEQLQTQQDAIDLIGDALYENNVMDKSLQVLRRKEFADFAGAIGLRTQTRYSANGVFAAAAELGEYLNNAVPMVKEAPQILQMTADAWNRLGQPEKREQNIERLALLLPNQSLWRARHRGDLVRIRKMEDLARPAAEAAAAAHYDQGLASGNPKSFATASAFYELLLDFAANAPQSNQWRLRHAHCQFFAGNNDDAAKLYESLKTEYKVDTETLQIASYQLVLTNEKRWREAFAKSAEHGEDAYHSVTSIAALRDLEKSIDEFAARFAGQSRAVDLLLVGGSANRDMNRFDSASKYWQRVLVSQPSATQRSLAVRGMVLASLKTGSSGDVVELARRYLKLEDWNALGLTIGNELRGVLSAATLDEGKRLSDSGHVLEAGSLMTNIAAEFASLPERDRIYRDGAYMLAIAGEWAAAAKAANDYFAAGLTQNRADMTYLLARAEEYQLRLHAAALKYQELGEKYPKHTRAASSLGRAERLAIAEGDYALAARAALALAARAGSDKERLVNYQHAADYLEKDGNANRALAVARRAQRTSKVGAERLRAELMIARLTYKTGSEQEALDSLAIIAKDVDRQRARLAAEDYAALAGEVHVLLGDEERRRFEDFHIVERGGDVAANVGKKSSYFQGLVSEYDRAAAAGDPRWASEARFQLARAAEALADEVAAIPVREGEALTSRSQGRYSATTERLQALARRYYTTNILTARKDPTRYQGNDWVKKSSLRLTGETSANPDARHKEMMPAAIQNTLPSDWSL